MSEESTAVEDASPGYDRRHVVASVSAVVLFVVGVVMVIDSLRLFFVTPGLPPHPLFELVALFMGLLAVIYAGLISAWVVREFR